MRLGLGVGAVELGVAEGPFGLRAPLLHPRRQIGALAPHREGAEHPFGCREGFGGPL